MIIENVRFKNNKGQNLSAKIYKLKNNIDSGVIFSHGLFSNKDGYKITQLAESIISTGNVLLTFDFSFCGESDGNITDISVIQEVNDLKHAVDFFTEYGVKNIHLMGSSMGGAVSILYASQSSHKIKSLITIATPVDFNLLISKIKKSYPDCLIPHTGTTEIDGLSIKNTFFHELIKIDMIEAVKKLNIPVLMFHGFLDDVVPVLNFDLFKKNLNSSYIDILIKNGKHNLTEKKDIEILKKNLINWLFDKVPNE